MGNLGLITTVYIAEILFTFAGIALYNTLELIVLILVTFKRYNGMYFWSLLLATAGIIPYTLSLLFKFFEVIKINMLTIAFVALGWQMMVTGQSLVMYSRLHLVTQNRKYTQYVLYMIIANWFISNVPTTVFVFGASSNNPAPWSKIYAVWERLQLCLYFVQESVISGLYVWSIMGMLSDTHSHETHIRKMAFSSRRLSMADKSKRVLKHLIYVNVIMVLLDISLLITEFIGHYEIQVLYKGALYSVKLKMEFWILNQLTDIASSKLRQSQMESGFSGEVFSPVGTVQPHSPLASPFASRMSKPETEGSDYITFKSPWMNAEGGHRNTLVPEDSHGQSHTSLKTEMLSLDPLAPNGVDIGMIAHEREQSSQSGKQKLSLDPT
ncbi:hypothetical protein BT63DRAFT_367747 [Microthyrium microscopicum]|uniref:DUF7703 domain-containing protein n=1 Tax=Microthyrium microscopicum TaxID=703497 RepID=A0A6A6UQQ3_9PEZI|nr:hypothetical protein BT63DRAFT_367747 [Microthyrium microscopicum]